MIALLALFACSGDAPDPADTPDKAGKAKAKAQARPDKPNLVIVTLDTTRADRIGAYGYEAAKTETIDSFAARGQRFDFAVSPVPLTIPAHATLFTGKDPHNHGVRNNGAGALREGEKTLAEVLQDNGYATAASVAAYVTTDVWGLAQGFDVYHDDIGDSLMARRSIWHLERPANEVVDDALEWLDSEERAKDKPFFLWVHVYDPHLPLRPPEGYQDGDAYDGEIAFVDDQVARVEAKLQELGVADDTLWVLTADHGEGHGDHTELGHGLFVYNNTQRVPLILAGPGIEPGVVSEPVGLVDVMPTVLGHLGIPSPDGIDGLAQPGGAHPLYLESYQLQERYGYSPHVAIIEGDRKLINTPRPELYALNDLGETNDLASAEPERVRLIQALLDSVGASPPSGEVTIDAETLERLAALGYVGGGGDMRTDAELADPKDKLGIIDSIQTAMRQAEKGEADEAIAKLEAVAAAEPELVIVCQRLSRLYAGKQDGEKAVYWIDKAVELEPDSSNVLIHAIIVHGKANNHERALELADHGLRLNPNASEMAEFKLMHMDVLGRTGDALQWGEGFLVSNPKATNVAGVLGVMYARIPDMEKAEPLLRHSLSSDNPPRWVNYMMANLASGASFPEEAVTYLQAELHEYPDNRQARLMLVRLLSDQKRYVEALPVVERMLKVRPTDLQLLLTKAQLHFNLEDYPTCEETLKAAEAVDPEEPELLLLKSNLLHKQGRDEESKAVFEAAKESKAKRMAEAGAKEGVPEGEDALAPEGEGTPAPE